MQIYYLGPEGTFSHQAAETCAASWRAEQLTACPTIVDAITRMFDDKTGNSLACVPIENSIDGSVTQTWDTVMRSIAVERVEENLVPARILSAFNFPIHQYLHYLEHTDFSAVETVYSHPKALAQCQVNLGKRFPKAQLVSVNSTAEAARMVANANDKRCVAIASQQAGERFGLLRHPEPMEDQAGNVTRFAMIGRQEMPGIQSFAVVSERVVSLCLRGVGHQPGGLVGTLAPIAEAGFNLTRVESRPVGNQFGIYVFYLDVTITANDERAERAFNQVVEELRQRQVDVVLLGAYPVYDASGV
ncbi:prephenate dehydratase [Alicyclobacillus fodiniaquatilis]|uniref:Prephenate dehydratase n=1 Tax=Alicyclobacillus fodiniaquatilis TaxID=1661150 RepID=A0ABW4JFF3_9BACL